MLLNRTHKIAAVYEQICPRPRILPPFFIHNFPCQLERFHSLFFYFYGRTAIKQKQLNLKSDYRQFTAIAPITAQKAYMKLRF